MAEETEMSNAEVLAEVGLDRKRTYTLLKGIANLPIKDEKDGTLRFKVIEMIEKIRGKKFSLPKDDLAQKDPKDDHSSKNAQVLEAMKSQMGKAS